MREVTIADGSVREIPNPTGAVWTNASYAGPESAYVLRHVPSKGSEFTPQRIERINLDGQIATSAAADRCHLIGSMSINACE